MPYIVASTPCREICLTSRKGNVSPNYYFGRSFKSTVSYLRDVWHGNTHRTTSGEMDLSVPEDEDPDFVIEVKKVDCFKLIKKSIKCANDRVAAIPIISGSGDGDLHINADYRPTNVPATAIPINTLVKTALNIEYDEDEHKYTNSWDMMRLDEKIGDFAVNSTMPFDDVAILEVFIEEEEEDEDDWDVSADL